MSTHTDQDREIERLQKENKHLTEALKKIWHGNFKCGDREEATESIRQCQIIAGVALQEPFAMKLEEE
jgi:hypothetical protein